MASIYIKIHDKSETVYVQSIIGTYCHLAWVRTENAEEGIIKIISTDDMVSEVRDLLENLKKEVEFEEIQIWAFSNYLPKSLHNQFESLGYEIKDFLWNSQIETMKLV